MHVRAKFKWLFFLAVASVRLAFGAPVSLEFYDASVSDVAQVLFGEVLRRDYVLAPDVVSIDKRITVSIRHVEQDDFLPIVEGILATVDVQVEERTGVFFVVRAGAAGKVSQGVMSGGFSAAAVGSGLSADQSRDQGFPVPSLLGGRSSRGSVPDMIESYQPRGRSVEFLAAVAKAAGVTVVDVRGGSKGGGDRLVYSGTEEAVGKARKILDEVDLPPASVTVRAVLVEFMDSDSGHRSLNVALTALADRVGLVFAAGTNLVNRLTWQTSGLNAVLSAIDGDSRFRYVAEPLIRVIDGEQAKFLVGSEQPTRGAVSLDNNGNTQQSIDYKSAGVQISVEPKILVDRVQLKVSQQVSSFALTTTSNIDSPTILKREASTTVSLRPGELVVLAGMDEQRDSRSSSGLFFLPGWLNGTSSEKTRSQLVLLLEVQLDDRPIE